MSSKKRADPIEGIDKKSTFETADKLNNKHDLEQKEKHDEEQERKVVKEMDDQKNVGKSDIAIASFNDKPRNLISDPTTTSNYLTNSYERMTSNFRTIAQEEIGKSHLSERALNVTLDIKPLNSWDHGEVFKRRPIFTIVNGIPSIVKLKKTVGLAGNDIALERLLTGRYGELPFVTESVKLFSSGTTSVHFVIDSKNTTENLQYDPETITSSTLNLEAFTVTGDDGTVSEDTKSRTEVFGGLLELCLKLAEQCDVIVQNVKTISVSAIPSDDDNDPLALLSGHSVPQEMLPHIYFSTHLHTLSWYKTEIRRIIPKDEIVIGEYGNVQYSNQGLIKLRSSYAVVTDNLAATLLRYHHLYLESKKQSPSVYIQLLEALTPHGSTVHLRCDSESFDYQVYLPSPQEIEQYIFLYLLSPRIRATAMNHQFNLLKNTKGISEVSYLSKLDGMNAPLDPTLTKMQINEIVIKTISGLTIDHFYQAMVLELNHAIIEPHITLLSAFTSPQDAALALLSICFDALIFPNTFWTNLHAYVLPIYGAIRYLAKDLYMQMISVGYTQNIKHKKGLTKKDFISGEVPFLFSRTASMPQVLRELVDAISPVGYLYEIPFANTFLNPFINSDPQFYIPFTYNCRLPLSTDIDTPFAEQVSKVILVITKLIHIYVKHNGSHRSVVQPIINMLTVIEVAARVYGNILHYEIFILYRLLANGPETLYTTYRGESCFNNAHRIGLVSSVSLPPMGLPAVDLSNTFPSGVGLFGLFAINGDRMTPYAQDIKSTSPSSFMFQNPSVRLRDFIEMVEKAMPIASAFGLMNHILQTNHNEDSSFHFLNSIIGSSHKASVAAKILKWLLNGVDPDTLMSQVGDILVPFRHPDTRFLAVRVCEVGVNTEPIEGDPQKSRLFCQPLQLLNPYREKKLDAVLKMVVGVQSPFHRYITSIVIARKFFQELSPDNRHDDPKLIVHYDDDADTIGVTMTGGESMVFFAINGVKYTSPIAPNFPRGIRVIIPNPSRITEDEWRFLTSAVESAEWQLELNKIQFLGTITQVTYDMAHRLSETGILGWTNLKTLTMGQIRMYNFYETKFNILNSKVDVKSPGFAQYVCATEPVNRNCAIQGITGTAIGQHYMPPEKNMWTIGNLNPEDIPRMANGVKKIDWGVNFNNFIDIWTPNATFNQTPIFSYIPPRGESL